MLLLLFSYGTVLVLYLSRFHAQLDVYTVCLTHLLSVFTACLIEYSTRPTPPAVDALVRLMFSNNFLSEGMGDLAANMSSFTTALKQVHELVALLV